MYFTNGGRSPSGNRLVGENSRWSWDCVQCVWCVLMCCSVTCQEKSLRHCSRWHALSSIVFPSGSRTMRRWELVCGGVMRKVEPVSLQSLSDRAVSATISTWCYSCLAFADIWLIDTSFSYNMSLCYTKSYCANTVDWLIDCLFRNSTGTVLVKMPSYTVCHCRCHCAFVWRAVSSFMLWMYIVVNACYCF